MGYANPPVCPAVLTQVHTGCLEAVGFEVRCPPSTIRAERGEELWGHPRSHHALGVGHMGYAGLQLAINPGDVRTPPMDSTLHISPSVICLRLFFFFSFISPNTRGFQHLTPQTNLISTGVNPKINFMSVF